MKSKKEVKYKYSTVQLNVPCNKTNVSATYPKQSGQCLHQLALVQYEVLESYPATYGFFMCSNCFSTFSNSVIFYCFLFYFKLLVLIPNPNYE